MTVFLPLVLGAAGLVRCIDAGSTAGAEGAFYLALRLCGALLLALLSCLQARGR